MTTLLKTNILSLLLLTACSTLTVQHDYDTQFDFSTLHSYAWLEGKAPSSDIRINNSLIINRVVKSVNNRLQAKGYRLVGAGKADFYVNWFGGIEDKIRLESVDSYYGHLGYGDKRWGYSGYWPGRLRTYSYEYQEGTLIIDIADSKSKQLIWRGTGRDYIEEKQTPEKITESINQTVMEILRDFPPAANKTTPVP